MQGDILNHEYMVKEVARRLPKFQRNGSNLPTPNSVGIDPGQNDILILAVAVAIDMLVHDDDDKKKKKEK